MQNGADTDFHWLLHSLVMQQEQEIEKMWLAGMYRRKHMFTFALSGW